MESNPSNNNNTNNQNNSEENRTSGGFFTNFFRLSPTPFFPFTYFRERSGWESSNYRIISSTQSNTRRNSEFAPQPTINSDEIRETIAQNLLEVQNLIDYGNYSQIKEENKISADFRTFIRYI